MSTPEATDSLQTLVQGLVQELRAGHDYPEAHRRVLSEAAALMGERGYAGASLRELARRLQMSQPSLYHYFDSKAQLVEQVVRFYTARALQVPDDVPVAPGLREGLRYVLQRIIENHLDPQHEAFVRFMLAVGRERPEVQVLTRALMLDRAKALMTRFVDLHARNGELLPEDSRMLVELVTNALVMRMLHDHLFPATPDTDADVDAQRFADFVVDTAVRGVEARKRTATES